MILTITRAKAMDFVQFEDNYDVAVWYKGRLGYWPMAIIYELLENAQGVYLSNDIAKALGHQLVVQDDNMDVFYIKTDCNLVALYIEACNKENQVS